MCLVFVCKNMYFGQLKFEMDDDHDAQNLEL